jgi:hypoxanthine phosphoribosyltransferase
MSRKPYEYTTRSGLLPISWEHFHGICEALAEAVGRGGYYPGALLSHMLQVELYPLRLSRRVNDVIVHANPQWIIEPPAAIAGQRALIVDEICDSGETLQLVTAKAAALGAASVRSAVLYSHSWGAEIPDYIGLISDALILNPWDREIWRDGRFQFHPELAQALASQGLQFDSQLLIPAVEVRLAKGLESQESP